MVDPRTGEILKGNVNLGSLRLRQDVLIGHGLVHPGSSAPAACGLSAAPGFAYLAEASGSDPVEMALARVRQLSAHEVGHTLGFPHNFIASTYGDRASVMDYPAPRVRITEDGELILEDTNGLATGYVVAKLGDIEGRARVRAAGSLPWQEDFEGLPAGEFPKGGAIIRRDGTRTRHYDQARRINAAVASLGPTLMRLTSAGVYRVRPEDDPTDVLAGTPLRTIVRAGVDPPNDYLVGTFSHADGRRADGQGRSGHDDAGRIGIRRRRFHGAGAQRLPVHGALDSRPGDR